MEGRSFRADSSVAARRVTVGIPILAIAALAVVVIGHLVKKRRNPGGKRLGGDGSHSSNNVERNGVEGDDEAETQLLENPRSIEELRARRIRSLEQRLSKSNGPGSARLTPLGTMIRISKKLDDFEKEIENSVSPHDDLMEYLTALRSEIDAVESDEAVRERRKTEASRIESLMLVLQQRNQ